MKTNPIKLAKILCFVQIALLVLFVAVYALSAQDIVDKNQTPDNAGQQLGTGLALALFLVFSLIVCGYDAVVQLVFGILFSKIGKPKGQKICLILYIVLHAIFVPAFLYIAVCLLATFNLPLLFVASMIAVCAVGIANLVVASIAISKLPKPATL